MLRQSKTRPSVGGESQLPPTRKCSVYNAFATVHRLLARSTGRVPIRVVLALLSRQPPGCSDSARVKSNSRLSTPTLSAARGVPSEATRGANKQPDGNEPRPDPPERRSPDHARELATIENTGGVSARGPLVAAATIDAAVGPPAVDPRHSSSAPTSKSSTRRSSPPRHRPAAVTL